jgi:hypothetical protein
MHALPYIRNTYVSHEYSILYLYLYDILGSQTVSTATPYTGADLALDSPGQPWTALDSPGQPWTG